jgi:hypothetical protein
MLSTMQYPHWLMVAGAVLVVIGFIGFAFHQNNAQTIENNPEQTSPTDEANATLARDAELKAKGK